MKKSFTLVWLAAITFSATAQKRPIFRTGMIPDEKKPEGVEVYDFESLGFGETLPDSISLRQYAPYPGNQGELSTCVGWAYGYAAMSILYAQKFGITNRNVITAAAMCPLTIYNQIKETSDISCSYGTHMHLAAQLLEKKGTKRFHISETDCNKDATKNMEFMVYKADEFYTLWDEYLLNNAKDSIKIANTKKALAGNKPVLIGFKTTYSFMYDIGKDGFWRKNESMLGSTGGHAMTVIGYNDKKFGGAFEIMNSWGPEWGDKGYCWISYKDFAKYTYNAYVIQLKEEAKTAGSIKSCELGDCKNGYCRYRFESGDIYEGKVKDGIPDGTGMYQYKNGDVFAGEFKNGKKEGKGMYYYNDGTVQKGYFAADTLNPSMDYLDYEYGTITTENGEYNGYYKGDKWIYGQYAVKAYGSIKYYLGKFKDGFKSDYGMNLYGGSSLYIGQFEDDFLRGYYTYINTTTETIRIYYSVKGEFKNIASTESLASKIIIPAEPESDTTATNDPKKCAYGDCENGYGKYTYSSGNTYEGFFTNGYRHGYGKYTFKADGKEKYYDGYYFSNKKEGLGKFKNPDGTIFIGTFSDNNLDGYGLFIGTEGKCVAGKWEKGTLSDWGEALGFGEAVSKEDLEKANSQTESLKKHKPQKQATIVLK